MDNFKVYITEHPDTECILLFSPRKIDNMTESDTTSDDQQNKANLRVNRKIMAGGSLSETNVLNKVN